MSTLDDAIQTIRLGDREEGRRMLEEILEVDESNEEVWLWLSSVVDTDEDREICLENVLALNPNNIVAQKGLEALRSGSFNVHDMMGEVLEEEEEDLDSGATFLEEFQAASLDDDLVMPSTMRRQQAKRKSGINIRLILLILFVLLIVLALGGVAAFNILLGGGEDGSVPPEGQPSQEAPAGGNEGTPAEPTMTDTPTPLPTDTPTPTNTPFQLPTPLPTDLPTPTATPVVGPTSAP